MRASAEHDFRAKAAPAAVAGVALLALLLVMAFVSTAQARVEAFQGLASSPANLTAFATDPTTGFVYAQENEGTAYFRYDPRTGAWTELAPAPIDSGNNGGAAYLGGKIYTVYTHEEFNLGVYDIASNSWTQIDNPLDEGTADIAAGNDRLYLVIFQKFLSLDPVTGIATPLAAAPSFVSAAEGEDCDEGFEAWGGLQVVEGKIYGHQGNGCTGFAVYAVASNSWQELPIAPKVQSVDPGSDLEGPVAGSAYDPLTNTYLTYGTYEGNTLYRYDIEAGSWSTSPLPFVVGDGGLAYVSQPGVEGVYLGQGEEGPQFTRYTERNVTDLSASLTSKVDKGGKIKISVLVKNNGPERAGGVVVSSQLPKGVKVVSAIASQRVCAGTTSLTCNLGVLPSGATAKATIKVKAHSKKLRSTATVSSFAIDSNAGNDSATRVAKQCVVPKLKTRGLKGAKKALRKANCKPGKVSYRFSGKAKEGKVIRGSKSRGKLLPAGSKVKLVVSLGPKGAQ